MSPKFVAYTDYEAYPTPEMSKKAADFYQLMNRRRTIREFSPDPIPIDVIKNALKTAGTAPSGANLQPWHFVVITDPKVKQQIRTAAEEEERAFYNGRAPEEWLKALEPLGTDEHKSFLTIAPVLIAVFAKSYNLLPDGTKVKNYYVQESVGLASGLLLTSLHQSGLATLTHTPSPMNFLNTILDRPKNERAMLLFVVGYPAEGVQVPAEAMNKKPLEDIATFI